MFGRKPTLADIYVSQIRTQLDARLVPVYSPATPNIRVGTIGRFTEGAFERRGHLEELLGGPAAFSEQVPLSLSGEPASFSFQSENSVKLEPSGTVSVAGKDLLKGRLSFSGERAVVAVFAGLVDRSVASPRTFDDLLWRLYYDGDLAQDEVVVWVHSEAASGTVLVNRKGNVNVELTVDPEVVTGGLGFDALGFGVKFGSGAQASAQLSGRNLTFAVQVKGLSPDDFSQVEDVRGFDGSDDESVMELLGNDIPSITTDDVICEADFTQPEV
jgi:hypothetical protein